MKNMRRHKYELKRLPDIDGKTNWSIKQCDPSIHIRVSWDYDEIRECVSNMKIGETKILEV